MAANEELNAAKLDDLMNALDDLKIVDVSRKPAGLSADLKVAGDFAARSEAQKSLEERGFFPAQLEANGPVELFSNEGEIHLIMKDGVEYVLRFGGIAGDSPSKKDEKLKGKGKDAAKSPDKKDGGGLNRYLFVMAEFDPDVIPKPQLEPLPEVKKEAAQKPAEPPKPAEKKPADAKKPAEEKKVVAEKKAEPPKPAEKKPEEKKAEPKKPESPKPEAPKPAANAGDKKQPEAKTAAADQAAKAERERIEKENKRKQDEYKQKIADGKKRVDELNNRFADWYYVISDEVYRKIHLSHDEIFKKKEKGKEKKDEHAGHDHGGGKDEAAPADPFEKLKQQGPSAK